MSHSADPNVTAAAGTTRADDPAYHDHGAHHHAVPVSTLLGVFAMLMVLTVLTVAVTYVDLGAANIWIALGIAVVKAALVVLYFMHLRWDSPFNALIFICALAFVALFLGIAILDSREYRPYLEAPGQAEIKRQRD